jgi:hypothetical protein
MSSSWAGRHSAGGQVRAAVAYQPQLSLSAIGLGAFLGGGQTLDAIGSPRQTHLTDARQACRIAAMLASDTGRDWDWTGSLAGGFGPRRLAHVVLV